MTASSASEAVIPAPTPEADAREIHRLRAEVERLTRERDVANDAREAHAKCTTALIAAAEARAVAAEDAKARALEYADTQFNRALAAEAALAAERERIAASLDAQANALWERCETKRTDPPSIDEQADAAQAFALQKAAAAIRAQGE